MVQARRSSGSSFEAGHLSASPEVTCSLGKKKRSGMLNLPGMSPPVRLPTSRSGSNASSLGGYGVPINNARSLPLILRSRCALKERGCLRQCRLLLR